MCRQACAPWLWRCVMAARVLPDSPDAFKDASWEDVLPHYDELATRALDTGNVEDWLADWSRFESLLSEAAALANFAYTCDTADTDRGRAVALRDPDLAPRARAARAAAGKTRRVGICAPRARNDDPEVSQPDGYLRQGQRASVRGDLRARHAVGQDQRR